jgi:hypothetical protein
VINPGRFACRSGVANCNEIPGVVWLWKLHSQNPRDDNPGFGLWSYSRASLIVNCSRVEILYSLRLMILFERNQNIEESVRDLQKVPD